MITNIFDLFTVVSDRFVIVGPGLYISDGCFFTQTKTADFMFMILLLFQTKTPRNLFGRAFEKKKTNAIICAD